MRTPPELTGRRSEMKKNRSGRTRLLIAFFVALVALATYLEMIGQEKSARNTPSASSSQKQGVRALYLLYEWKGYKVDQLKNPWTDLKPSDALLVFVQPSDSSRPIKPKEASALEKWVREGGTFLGIVSPPPANQPFDPKDPLTGDVSVFGVSQAKTVVDINVSVSPAVGLSPLMKSVSKLSLDSDVRLRLKSDTDYVTLGADPGKEPFLVQKKFGKGQVIVYANRSGTTNAGIDQEDNSILLLNIAKSVQSETRKTIQFDEYHHGIGFAKTASEEDSGLWESFPSMLKALVIFSGVLSLLLIYNGNRRFVPAISPVSKSLRSSTDYVVSMARLYRKAGASDIAFEMMYRTFIRDLKKRLEIDPETPVEKLTEFASKSLNLNPQELGEILHRGEAVSNGERMTEKEMLHYTMRIEEMRRAYNIVGV